MVRPLLRNAVCWNRDRIVSKSKFDGLEDVGVGPEGDRRPGLVRVVERLVLRQRAAGDTVVEGHPEHVAHLADLDVEPAGEGVDHGGADTVQPAGHLVAAAAELPAGVQLREHQLHGGDVLAVALAGGDAAAVVDDGHAAVGAQRHVDAVGVAGEGLVHRVVDDLPDEVVQAALTGRADVHAGPLAHGVEAFEDLDRLGVVGRGGLGLGRGQRPRVREPPECRQRGPGSREWESSWSVRPRTRCSFVHRPHAPLGGPRAPTWRGAVHDERPTRRPHITRATCRRRLAAFDSSFYRSMLGKPASGGPQRPVSG